MEVGTEMSKKRTCLSPFCDVRFTPEHAGQFWHGAQCYSGHLIAEVGATAAGMRPLGLMGDKAKIQAFNRKWIPHGVA